MKALSSYLAGLLVMACLIPLSLIAQPQRGQRQGPHPEMRAYLEQEVLPVMTPQRQKLDGYLSPADQVELNQLRTDLRTLRENRPARGRQGGKGRTAMTPEQRDEMRAHRDQRLALHDRAEDLADRYATQIAALLDEIAPQAETWRTDIEALRATHRPERPQGPAAYEDRPYRRGHGQKGPRQGQHRAGPLKFLTPSGFLLWDPANPLPGAGAQDATRLSLTPNPAQDAVTVAFTLKTEGPVHLYLVDARGERVRDFDAGRLAAGSHQQRLSLSGLQPGVYVVQLLTPEGTESRKVKVE